MDINQILIDIKNGVLENHLTKPLSRAERESIHTGAEKIGGLITTSIAVPEIKEKKF